jgi:hypothetical protein
MDETTQTLEQPKSLAEAGDFEEFKKLRANAPIPKPDEAPAKPPQAEEAKPKAAPESAPDSETGEKIPQAPPAEGKQTLEDRIAELRKQGKHAVANKLLMDEARKASQQAAAERERAIRLERELQEAKKQPPVQPAAQQSQPAQLDDPEPNPDDPKYATNLALYLRDVRVWDKRQNERTAAVQSFSQKRDAVLAAGNSAYQDFGAVTDRVVLNSAVLQKAVQEIPNAADVLYRVGSDLSLLGNIQRMDPVAQWTELVLLSRSLNTSQPPATQPANLRTPVTRVAPPPTPIRALPEPPPDPAPPLDKGYDGWKSARKKLKAG